MSGQEDCSLESFKVRPMSASSTRRWLANDDPPESAIAGTADTEFRDLLRRYYRNPAIRTRMQEFLGPGAQYIVATDGRSDFTGQSPLSLLPQYLDAGMEVDRSLWDQHSLVVDIDIEYTNFDHPAAAWANPERAFGLQAPVMDEALRILGRAGIDPLILVSGRGFHLAWSVARDSIAFRRLVRLGRLPPSLEARYAQVESPDGAKIESDICQAYAGLGMVVEFLGHRVLAQSAEASAVPVQMTAIEVGPGPCGREIVSFDLSEYGDPLHRRHVRLPFSAYLKPRQLEWALGEAGVRRLLPIFEIPLADMSAREAITVMRDPEEALRLSRRVHVFIPDQSLPMEALIDSYERSGLAAFHNEFYRQPWKAVSFGDTSVRVSGAPPCVNWLLEYPNDWLLRPAALQHAARVLTALDWSPRAIARLICARYESDSDWGNQWAHLDPMSRAIFYTRLFTGMLATGVDRVIDLNCVSHKEKGYCMVADCSANLAPYRDRLLEKRRFH